MNWLICKPYELPYQPKKTFVIIQGGITTKNVYFVKKKTVINPWIIKLIRKF